MQVVSLGLRFLSASGIVDVAQPALERLAAHCGELVRLTSVDDDRLIYVAKAQGATQGLRYDPEMGRPVALACSAAGFAWLATKSDEEALRQVSLQGFGDADDFGPAAPRTDRPVQWSRFYPVLIDRGPRRLAHPRALSGAGRDPRLHPGAALGRGRTLAALLRGLRGGRHRRPFDAPYLDRLNQPTPWTSRMMPSFRGMTRGFCHVDSQAPAPAESCLRVGYATCLRHSAA